jgi:hypothetical protein
MFQVMLVDHLIHVPGHGKDEVDDLNATSNKFICLAMATIQQQQGSHQQ